MGNPVLWLPSTGPNRCDIASPPPYLSRESCHSLTHSSSSSFEHYLPELPSTPHKLDSSCCLPCDPCCTIRQSIPNIYLPSYLSSSTTCLSSAASSSSLFSSYSQLPLSMGFEARPRSRLPMPIQGARLIEPYPLLDTKPTMCVRATKRIGVPVMPLPRSKSFHQLLRSTQNGQILASRGTIRGSTSENAPRTVGVRTNNPKNIQVAPRISLTKNLSEVTPSPRTNVNLGIKCNTFSKKTASSFVQHTPNVVPHRKSAAAAFNSGATRKLSANDGTANNNNNNNDNHSHRNNSNASSVNLRMKVNSTKHHQNYGVNQSQNTKTGYLPSTNANELTTKLPQVIKARPEAIVDCGRRLHQSDTNLSSKQTSRTPDTSANNMIGIVPERVHHQSSHPTTTSSATSTTAPTAASSSSSQSSVPIQMPRKPRTTLPIASVNTAAAAAAASVATVNGGNSSASYYSSVPVSSATHQSTAPIAALMRATVPMTPNKRSVSKSASSSSRAAPSSTTATVITATSLASVPSMVVQHYAEQHHDCGRSPQKRINQSISSSNGNHTIVSSSASSFTPLFVNIERAATQSNSIFTSTSQSQINCFVSSATSVSTGSSVNVVSAIRCSVRKPPAVRSTVQSRANVNDRCIGLSTPDLAKTNEQKCQQQNRNKIKRSVSSFDGGSYLSRLRNNLTSGLQHKQTTTTTTPTPTPTPTPAFYNNNKNGQNKFNSSLNQLGKTRSTTPIPTITTTTTTTKTPSSLSSLSEAHLTLKTESPWKLRRPKPTLSGLDGTQSQYMSFEFLNERITSRLQREFDFYNGQLQQFGTVSSVSALSGVELNGSRNDCTTRERSASLSHGGSVGTNSMTNSSADDDNETDTSRSTISTDSANASAGDNGTESSDQNNGKNKAPKLAKKKSFRRMLENYFVNGSADNSDSAHSSSDSHLSQLHNLRTNSKISLIGSGSYQRQTEHLFGKSKENFLLKRTTPNAGLKESLKHPNRFAGSFATSGSVTQFHTVTNRQLEIFENILRQTLMANSIGDDKETVKNFGLVSSSKFVLEDQKIRENNSRNADSLDDADMLHEIECDSILGLDDILALESPLSSRRSSIERFEIDVENELQDYRCFWVPLNDLTSESDVEVEDKSMVKLSVNSKSLVARTFLEQSNFDEIITFDIGRNDAAEATVPASDDGQLPPLPNAAFFTLSNQLKTLLYNSNRWKSTNVYYNY